MFAEREGLIPGSSDFGASYFAPLPGGYGEFHAGVYNGEGYAQPELNKYKSVQGRLTVRPLPNAGTIAKAFRVSGFYNAGWYADDRPRRLGIVMGSFEHPHLVATLEGLKATENPLQPWRRRAISIAADGRCSSNRARASSGLAGIFRYDAFDPDRRHRRASNRTASSPAAPTGSSGRARRSAPWSPTSRCTTTSRRRPDENRLLAQMHVEF